MNRFERVIEILDNAIGGPQANIRAHGPFWRGTKRDEFIGLKVFDEQLLVVGQGAASNLIKALKGEAPFDGSRFPRMPAGRQPVAADDIAFIERWIDEGCQEDVLPAAKEAAFTWRPTNAPMANQDRGKRYDDLWFISPDVGWAVNSDGKILHTQDAGASWQQQFHDANLYLRCVGFASASRGWVGTLNRERRLLETGDGGATWTAVAALPEQAPANVCGLCVVNDSVVYASGTNFPFPFADNPPPRMMKTVDGGATWTAWDMTGHACLLVDTYFATPERGFVVGGRLDPSLPPGPEGRDNVRPVLLSTDDGGATWVDRLAEQSGSFPAGEWGWKIDFLNDQLGFVSLENPKEGAVLKTTDGGTTWTRIKITDPQGNADLEGVGFIDEQHGWVGGWGHPEFVGGQSSETTDGGQTWRDANETGKFMNRFRFFGHPVTVGYAAGATVYKYSTEPVPVASPPRMALAGGARLVAPAGPDDDGHPVRIPIAVPQGASRLMVNIWTRFGRHVRRLVDETALAPGDRVVEWDATDDAGRELPAGGFIVRVTVDDDSESHIIRGGG
jgi:photosystem II stability/assembly factor-like uncharacterized protein